METTNHLITTPASPTSSSCHGTSRDSVSWLGRWRGVAIGGGAIVTGIALALNQHWVLAVQLIPLLYVLPCALMMLMCMKGMNHGQRARDNHAPVSAITPVGNDAIPG